MVSQNTGEHDVSGLGETGKKGLKAILVPTDFSESSDMALQIAIDLARQQNARIYLLHVLPLLKKAIDKPGLMQAQLEKIPELKSVEIVQEIKKGKLHEEILKFQIEKNIDMIVIARHVKSDSLYARFRSITEKVKKEAQCSVLVVGV